MRVALTLAAVALSAAPGAAQASPLNPQLAAVDRTFMYRQGDLGSRDSIAIVRVPDGFRDTDAAGAAAQHACYTDSTPPPISRDALSTGDLVMDALLATEIARLIHMTRISAELVITRGAGGPVAFATSRSRSPSKRGTIVFSDSVLMHEAADPSRSEVAAINVIAHEFGHLVQFAYGSQSLQNQSECELGADYLAGYLLSAHPMYTDSTLLAHVGQSFARAEQNETDSHGRYLQRVAAFSAGLRANGEPIDVAAKRAEEAVRELVDTVYNASGLRTMRGPDHNPVARSSLLSEGLRTRVGIAEGQPVFLLTEIVRNTASEPLAVRWLIDVVAHRQAADESLSRRGCQVIVPPARRARLAMQSRAIATLDWASTSIQSMTITAFVPEIGNPLPPLVTCPEFTLLPQVP